MEILSNSERVYRLLVKAFGPGVGNHKARQRLSQGKTVSFSLFSRWGKQTYKAVLTRGFVTVRIGEKRIRVPHVPFTDVDVRYEKRANPRALSKESSAALKERYFARFDSDVWGQTIKRFNNK